MSTALESLKPDPMEVFKKHHLAYQENLCGWVRESWYLGRALTKQIYLRGERALDAFLKENNMDRNLVVTSRDIYERHSLEGISELPVEELEALVS